MEIIKDFFVNAFSSRIRVVSVVMGIFAAVLISRLFYLQIINGSEYQDNYNLKLEKTETIPATRGNIYDRNGNLLAYNELVYAVTIQDNGSYSNKKVKSESLNSEIAEIITKLQANGDEIDNNFPIYIDSSNSYQFMYSGSALQRFRADVFGKTSIDDLEYNEKLGIDEANATADDIINYLQGERVYNISDEYNQKLRYEIMVVRYNMGQNSYQKYISTVIASDISEKSVAYIEENVNELTGVAIEQKSLRRYKNSEYFAHIIGYTGQISTDEYKTRSAKDDSVEATDIVGKSGIEKYMDDYLSGTKGAETLFVDSVGNTIAEGDYTPAVSGNDVYLSIDMDLQKATYTLLEQEIAGILYSKIANIKQYHASENASSSDVVVPIYDVYNSLIANGIIDTTAFSDEKATDTEKAVLAAYKIKEKEVLANLKTQLKFGNEVVYKDLPDEYQAYSTFIVTKLKSLGIFDSSAIDSSSEVQENWTSENMAVNKYLLYAIEQNWIDITKYESEAKYADTEELYNDLINYTLEYISQDKSFQNLIYKYLLLDDGISGTQLCIILYDQGVLKEDAETYSMLKSGRISAYEFMLSKIKNLELTPGQLALDPCSGSTVILDVKTGEVLAMVTYPGYDNNRLANSVDSDYYAYLTNSAANPLYNYATQQRTAPGSTFKIVSSTAGLAENVITTTSEIVDLGQYTKVSNNPKCWIYPSNHGSINVSEAIRDSCNYFFYEVGWRLSGGDGAYDDVKGIEKISKYASLYGLDETTGVEIEENSPHIATEYPVMAAIGQSDNNYTTVGLARYATAIASRGTVYNLTLLDSVRDSEGNVVESYKPSVRNQIDVLNAGQWDAIHYGMKMVTESLSSFNNFSVPVAGKTGTAQQVKSRPNHALFIGFAPYNNPEIALATRIAYGYTSHNAAAVSKDIMSYYFGVSSTEELLSGEATSVSNSGNEVTD
ncbi:penicillin-binding protein 2 [Pseudobutyrivibrio sp. 49]|uniref:penicillin-binding transpeptidase domain-containing protein n=1 Tax=unclassified Pseudobutyrivibrio TaxID=2638619 RepID=UPI00088C320C|nr:MULTISPECIES: penicillin-binding transpeptidase domain-containing protein [unclassified Pseudobutyrivibrio]SDH43366.1 penicillin-binding protein 2 [Pseudobutyrivibrio sp. 49]SFN44554.1 penicillin-binding protein 2 [Pseudobutyrivibrio sp. UC1225]